MSSFKFEAWPTEHRKITQFFGVNPEKYAQFGLPGHDGVDIKAPTGSKVFAVAPGRVERVQPVPDGKGYGIHVRIAHADGYETIYAHLEKSLVRVGNRVQAGTLIGLADSTGNSTGSHLHLVLKRHGETFKNWPFNITDPMPFLMPLLSWQEPAGPYVEGWVYAAAVTVVGELAQVNSGDAHLREEPGVDAEVIDLIPAGTLLIVNGDPVEESIPVRVPSRALDSAAVELPPPEPASETPVPPDDIMLAWAWEDYLEITGKYAMVGRRGVNLRSAPLRDSALVGKVQWGFLATIIGPSINGYAPIYVYVRDVLDRREDVAVQEPRQWPDGAKEPVDESRVLRGWVLTSQITIEYLTAVVGREGTNIRNAPKRNAKLLAYAPLGVSMRILGPPTGEYTPVLANKEDIQEITVEEEPEEPLPDPDPLPLGQAGIGLHASADPDITEAEITEFALFRPSIIKVLSFHNPAGLRRLVSDHPDVGWVVRAFLDFGGRSLNPQRFFNDTISDMERTLAILQGKDVVIELHNEPNVTAEGLGSSWQDGAEFSRWWLRLLRLYRYAFPDYRFIFPGLSPGPGAIGTKDDHVRFLESCREAIAAADGLGVHVYWSAYYPMKNALAVLDDVVNRFQDKPIWVTEASNNKNGTSATSKAYEYLGFWKELQQRPTVEGVTYFVASAINPAFKEEVFVGRGMARIIGAR